MTVRIGFSGLGSQAVWCAVAAAASASAAPSLAQQHGPYRCHIIHHTQSNYCRLQDKVPSSFVGVHHTLRTAWVAAVIWVGMLLCLEALISGRVPLWLRTAAGMSSSVYLAGISLVSQFFNQQWSQQLQLVLGVQLYCSSSICLLRQPQLAYRKNSFVQAVLKVTILTHLCSGAGHIILAPGTPVDGQIAGKQLLPECCLTH